MSIQQVSRGLMAELFARFQKGFLQKTSDFEQFYHKQLLNSQLQMTSKAIHMATKSLDFLYGNAN